MLEDIGEIAELQPTGLFPHGYFFNLFSMLYSFHLTIISSYWDFCLFVQNFPFIGKLSIEISKFKLFVFTFPVLFAKTSKVQFVIYALIIIC